MTADRTLRLSDILPGEQFDLLMKLVELSADCRSGIIERRHQQIASRGAPIYIGLSHILTGTVVGVKYR